MTMRLTMMEKATAPAAATTASTQGEVETAGTGRDPLGGPRVEARPTSAGRSRRGVATNESRSPIEIGVGERRESRATGAAGGATDGMSLIASVGDTAECQVSLHLAGHILSMSLDRVFCFHAFP